jgi:FKBP-type peptidyl-prolyl cis-trans isomerase SlyD
LDLKMTIEKNKVVQFHYELSNEKGELLENSRESEAMAYLHGHNNMLAGLEAEMVGKAAGETFSVTLTPKDAYGEYNPEAVARVPLKHLIGGAGKGAIKWKKGMVANVQTEQGQRQVVITKVGLKVVDVDTNHPYAGHTLTFNVEVVDVRDASAEEIQHGHAHGAGGHHH